MDSFTRDLQSWSWSNYFDLIWTFHVCTTLPAAQLHQASWGVDLRPLFFVTSFFWFQAAWKLILALLWGQGLQICYVCHLDHLDHRDHRDHLGHLDHLLQELPWWKEADGRWIRSGIIRLPIFLGVSNKQQIYGKFEKAPFFFPLIFCLGFLRSWPLKVVCQCFFCYKEMKAIFFWR